jgi:hypothetical protein
VYDRWVPMEDVQYRANVTRQRSVDLMRFWTNYWKNRDWRDDVNKELEWTAPRFLVQLKWEFVKRSYIRRSHYIRIV